MKKFFYYLLVICISYIIIRGMWFAIMLKPGDTIDGKSFFLGFLFCFSIGAICRKFFKDMYEDMP